MPEPERWLGEWRAARTAAAGCQRAFFDAFADRLARAHWELEWDAQPFRISASPPRTLGKMLHQLVTANYFHLTHPSRPPLRRAQLRGEQFHPLAGRQPGFRWQVLDTADSLVGRALGRDGDAGCAVTAGRAAWHCVWQRFPYQRATRPPPPAGTALGGAAEALYNASLAGSTREGGMVQYLVAAGVMKSFSEPTSSVISYLRRARRVLCHRGGPHCGGSADELATPVAALHVRHGDSCDRMRTQSGPFNSMWSSDEHGNATRIGYRYCYAWSVYLGELRRLQRDYNVRTVLVATDDATGGVLNELPRERGFNWVWLDYPRAQFAKRGWIEFRADLDGHMPLSLAAELQLIGDADVLVGNMGSHTSRLFYHRMVAAAATSVLPPFVSVDGYGLCCDFTEKCSVGAIRERGRSVRECIYSYGTCTNGVEYFHARD